MAGIYDRISGTVGPTDKISANLIHASYVLRALGEFTDTQILDALNATVANNLAGAELTDLTNIAAAMDAETGTVDKLVYAERLRATAIAIEEASLSDANMRSILGIV